MTTKTINEQLKLKYWNVFRYDKKTGTSNKLGVVRARGNPEAVRKGWKKFKVLRTNEELKKIYARVK